MNGDWPEWSRFILAELKRLNEVQEKIDTKLQKVTIDIAMLKVKSGVWGMMGGLIPIIIVLVIEKYKA